MIRRAAPLPGAAQQPLLCRGRQRDRAAAGGRVEHVAARPVDGGVAGARGACEPNVPGCPPRTCCRPRHAPQLSRYLMTASAARVIRTFYTAAAAAWRAVSSSRYLRCRAGGLAWQSSLARYLPQSSQTLSSNTRSVDCFSLDRQAGYSMQFC